MLRLDVISYQLCPNKRVRVGNNSNAISSIYIKNMTLHTLSNILLHYGRFWALLVRKPPSSGIWTPDTIDNDNKFFFFQFLRSFLLHPRSIDSSLHNAHWNTEVSGWSCEKTIISWEKCWYILLHYSIACAYRVLFLSFFQVWCHYYLCLRYFACFHC